MKTQFLSKTSEVVTKMVLVVDGDNRASYVHYTGDLSKNSYVVDGEEFGKHLFGSISVSSRDIATHRDSIPYGTVYSTTPVSGKIVTNVDYYIDPKSAVNLVVEDLKRKVLEAEKRARECEGDIERLKFKSEQDLKLQSMKHESQELARTRILESKLTNCSMRLSEQKNLSKSLQTELDAERASKANKLSYYSFFIFCLLVVLFFIWAIN